MSVAHNRNGIGYDVAVRRTALIGIALLAACAVNRSTSAPRAGEPSPSFLPEAYRSLGDEIARARGLSFTRSLAVHVLDAQQYRDLLASRLEPPPPDVADPEFRYAFGFSRLDPLAVWHLGLLPPRRDDEMAHEQVLGFYAPRDRVLYVRSDGNASQMTDIVAHELAHAIVDDHSNLLRELDKKLDDVDLARRALVEGDAIITQIVVKARRTGRDVDEAVREEVVEARVRSLSQVEGLPVPVSAEQLAKANPLDRARFLFPYLAGTFFAGQLWRAGGTAAVDAALAAPPESTEQVLYPDRYVMGDRPCEVDAPSLPNGWTERVHGRMGVLKTRVFLAQWMPFEDAVEASTGWGGDAYVVAHRKGRTPLVAWATAWDDEAAAARFETALRKTTACDPSSPCLRGPTEIRRDGLRVAYVRGVADEAFVARALGAVHDRPALRPPIAPLSLPTIWNGKAPEFRHQDERVCTSGRAGVRVTAPEGFVFMTADDDDPCNIVRPATGENLKLLVFGGAPIESSIEPVKRGILATLRDAHLSAEEEDGTRMTLLGRARVLRYRLENGAVVELSFVGICGGHKTLEIISRWSTELGRTAVEHAVSSLRPASVGLPDGCTAAPR